MIKIAIIVVAVVAVVGVILYVALQPGSAGALPPDAETGAASSEAAGIVGAIGGSVASIANQLITSVDAANRRAGEAAERERSRTLLATARTS